MVIGRATSMPCRCLKRTRAQALVQPVCMRALSYPSVLRTATRITSEWEGVVVAREQLVARPGGPVPALEWLRRHTQLVLGMLILGALAASITVQRPSAPAAGIGVQHIVHSEQHSSTLVRPTTINRQAETTVAGNAPHAPHSPTGSTNTETARQAAHKMSALGSSSTVSYLLYTSVGSSKAYLHLLQLMLASIDYHCSPAPEFDVLVIVDDAAHNFLHAHHRAFKFVLHLMWLGHDADKPGADSGVSVSMRKMAVHQWGRIRQYQKVLFMDADILVNMDVSALFRLPIRLGILYAANTNTDFVASQLGAISTAAGSNRPQPPTRDPYPIHQLQWFGFRNYTATEMDFMRARGVLWFHAGMFLFQNTPAMQHHFTQIRAAIMSHTGEYYYEQSFINYHFNTRALSNTTLLTPYVYEVQVLIDAKAVDFVSYVGKLVHFNGLPGPDKVPLADQFFKRLFVNVSKNEGPPVR